MEEFDTGAASLRLQCSNAIAVIARRRVVGLMCVQFCFPRSLSHSPRGLRHITSRRAKAEAPIAAVFARSAARASLGVRIPNRQRDLLELQLEVLMTRHGFNRILRFGHVTLWFGTLLPPNFPLSKKTHPVRMPE